MNTGGLGLRAFIVLSFLLVVGTFLGRSPSVAAEAVLVSSSPAANAVLAKAPAQIELTFSGPVDPAAATIAIFGSDHKPVGDAPHFQPVAGNPNKLTAAMPSADKGGVFTIVWSATDGSTPSTGAFAFQVDVSGNSPTVVEQPQPVFVLSPRERVVTKWLAFITMMTFIGTLGLRFLVAAPVIGRLIRGAAERTSLLALADRRLVALSGLALLLFIPSSVSQLVFETSAAAKVNFYHAWHYSLVEHFVNHTPAGNVWRIRLIITAILALVFLPVAAKTALAGWSTRPRWLLPAMFLAMLAGSSEFLIRTMPATILDTPSNMVPRVVFTWLLDWGHLMGAAFWVGGLVALLSLAVFLRPQEGDRGPFWSAAIRRYSLVASACVGSMILTGLWTAWIHVGSPDLLFTTLYGKTLLVKLCLVLTLICLGAVNQVWLLPRIEAIRAADPAGRSHLGVILRHFKQVIALEVFVGLAILFVVPFLSGSSRNQDFQTKLANLKQSGFAIDTPVSLKPSSLQPGLNQYDVQLDKKGDPGKVILVFSSPELKVPETSVVANNLGGGHYSATGIYTPIVGKWNVNVDLAPKGKDVMPAFFQLPVQAKPLVGKSATPPIKVSTWEYGIGEVLLVVCGLIAANVFSRFLSGRFRQRTIMTA